MRWLPLAGAFAVYRAYRRYRRQNNLLWNTRDCNYDTFAIPTRDAAAHRLHGVDRVLFPKRRSG